MYGRAMAVLVAATGLVVTWAPTAGALSVMCRHAEVTINATGGNDYIVGTADQDVINGGDGQDTIVGLGGDDIICGGNGDDILYGDDGADEVFGDAGNDTIRLGAGIDRGTGGSQSWYETVVMDDGNDYIDGGPGYDDRLVGGNAVFALNSVTGGDDGSDTIVDSDGVGSVYGGHLSFFDAAFGADGNDTITIGGTNKSHVFGDHWGTKNGSHVTGSAADTITTSAGDDVIYGDTWNQGVGLGTGGGGDTIVAGGGNDKMYGGAGNDICNGGTGTDTAHSTCELKVQVP